VVGVKMDERENKSEVSVDPPKVFPSGTFFEHPVTPFVQKLDCVHCGLDTRGGTH